LVARRVCVERDGPQLHGLRQALEIRGQECRAVENQLATVEHQVQAREHWWRTGVQQLEAGVEVGIAQRNRLMATAEENWHAERDRLASAVRGAEASLGQQAQATNATAEEARAAVVDATRRCEAADRAAQEARSIAAELRTALHRCEEALGDKTAVAAAEAAACRVVKDRNSVL